MLKIGSRGSALALWQANFAADALRAVGHEVEILVIKTTGDRMQEPGFVAPGGVDGKGIFTKEIEEALASEAIDLAVHSLKDLPTELDDRFELGGIPRRADARDALVCADWLLMHTLPIGARVGTTSPRRKAMLAAHRPDFEFVEVRGNVDTRLRKMEAGECDALVLAAAGLDRLGLRADWVRQRFAAEEVCPAPGQGALGIEVRAGDERVIAAVREVLENADTRYCVTVERALLRALGGGCSVPVGAYCERGDEGWVLHAAVVSADGEQMVTVDAVAAFEDDAEGLGEWAAADLLGRGAAELLAGGDGRVEFEY